jgi:hypothetical protein
MNKFTLGIVLLCATQLVFAARIGQNTDRRIASASVVMQTDGMIDEPTVPTIDPVFTAKAENTIVEGTLNGVNAPLEKSTLPENIEIIR